ncbi:hypothetical protein [Kitasatospora viridis]|nr:hypothetical protein [Kitasatospora viridis]
MTGTGLGLFVAGATTGLLAGSVGAFAEVRSGEGAAGLLALPVLGMIAALFGAPAGILPGAASGLLIACAGSRGRIRGGLLGWLAALTAVCTLALEGIGVGLLTGDRALVLPFLAGVPFALFATRFLTPQVGELSRRLTGRR